MPHASQDLPALRQRARSRGGVVSTQDLRACGFSSGAVCRRIDEGSWQRWGKVVLLSPSDPTNGGDRPVPSLSDLGLAWALQLTFGPRAAMSGCVALRRSGWSLPVDTPIVVVPDKPRVGVPGVFVMRRRPHRIRVLDGGLRFVPAMDALLDTLIALGPRSGADLLDVVLQQRMASPEEFADAVATRSGSGRRGASTLGEFARRALSGSRSEAEQRMAALLKRSGTGPWVANLAVRDSRGRVVAEADFAHESLRIAIEVDGRAHHSDRRAFERDRSRQNQLMLMGWLVLRFTWEQITQRPDEVLAAISAAVALRLVG